MPDTPMSCVRASAYRVRSVPIALPRPRSHVAAAIATRQLADLSNAAIRDVPRLMTPVSTKNDAAPPWCDARRDAAPAVATPAFRPRIVHGAQRTLPKRSALPTLNAVRPAARPSRIDGEPLPNRRRMRRAVRAAIVRRLRRHGPVTAGLHDPLADEPDDFPKLAAALPWRRGVRTTAGRGPTRRHRSADRLSASRARPASAFPTRLDLAWPRRPAARGPHTTFLQPEGPLT